MHTHTAPAAHGRDGKDSKAVQSKDKASGWEWEEGIIPSNASV